MKRNEYGDACYDESNVLFWVLPSPEFEIVGQLPDEGTALDAAASGETEEKR